MYVCKVCLNLAAAAFQIVRHGLTLRHTNLYQCHHEDHLNGNPVVHKARD